MIITNKNNDLIEFEFNNNLIHIIDMKSNR